MIRKELKMISKGLKLVVILGIMYATKIVLDVLIR